MHICSKFKAVVKRLSGAKTGTTKCSLTCPSIAFYVTRERILRVKLVVHDAVKLVFGGEMTHITISIHSKCYVH